MAQRPSSSTPLAASSRRPLHPNSQPFVGIVDTTVQAMRLVYAAQQGIIPRTIRRLTAEERKTMIFSGAVFVFGVEESGIKRWTDGRLWSPSRITGNFLVYKELTEKNTGPKDFDRFEEWILADGATYSDVQPTRQRDTQGMSLGSNITFDQGLKLGGLVKKTMTVKLSGIDFHLISYYVEVDIENGHLRGLSSRPDILSLYLPSNIFTFSDFRIPPKVVVGKDGVSRIICESDVGESNILAEPRGPETGENSENVKIDPHNIQDSGPVYPSVVLDMDTHNLSSQIPKETGQGSNAPMQDASSAYPHDLWSSASNLSGQYSQETDWQPNMPIYPLTAQPQPGPSSHAGPAHPALEQHRSSLTTSHIYLPRSDSPRSDLGGRVRVGPTDDNQGVKERQVDAPASPYRGSREVRPIFVNRPSPNPDASTFYPYPPDSHNPLPYIESIDGTSTSLNQDSPSDPHGPDLNESPISQPTTHAPHYSAAGIHFNEMETDTQDYENYWPRQ